VRERRKTASATTLSEREMRLVDAWWRAASYLSVGQIYPMNNSLLRKPLRPEHVRPRLLRRWGTPGPDLPLRGPEHGDQGPRRQRALGLRPRPRRTGIVAAAYLEGTYSEIHPEMSQDIDGRPRLFTQFSFPGGVSSHVARDRGSIHEGGEFGYALVHLCGAAVTTPPLVVAVVVGDGEAETGSLATSWHSNRFPQPGHRRRGAAGHAAQRLQDR
jgi:xylulose-5-phosphate/fructose-6-phosphate phosphoketolase